jgi:SPW repeat
MTRAHDPLPLIAAGLVSFIAVAPWLLGFSGSHAAVAGHIAFAMTFAPIALLIRALPAAATVVAAAGVWLAISPWALGYASRGGTAWASDVLAGLALIVLGRRA